MKDITTALMQQFRREHKAARRYMALLLALALLTSLFVNWQLHSVGIAQTADYQCGEIEHQHTAECYEKVLVCGYEEGEPEDWNATKPDDSAFPDADYGVEQSDADIAAYSAEPEPEYIFVPHQHTDDCYQEVKTLTCYQEEHVHTDDCFDPEDGSLICDLFEHTHDDSCYTVEYELVCGLEEGELVEEPNPDYVPVDEEAFAVFDDAVALQPVVDDSSLDTPVHHHTDACYEEVLVCGLPEHHHTVNCLSDPLADVEDEETWSTKTNVVLTGAWADDLTAVAKSQLGYQQSERNFKLDDEDQTTVRHYTRYGAWYGNAYGAWDVMFLSYCLNYANVPQTTVPQRAGVQALRSDLRGSEWLKAAAEVELVPGDIVFYNNITTETVAVEEDAPQIMDDSADADIALLSLEPAAAEPQTEERTVSTETVGIVSDVDADTGTLTVISGDVDGKVAEVSLRADEITDVIDLAAADKAQEDHPAAGGISHEELGEQESALVIWPISEEELAQYPMMLSAELDETAATGNQALTVTNVTFQKHEGNNWPDIQEGDTVKENDEIRMYVDFTLAPNTFAQLPGTVYYQLPRGLKLDEPITNGVIRDPSNTKNDPKGEPVGSYTIDKDGKVTLTFDDGKINPEHAFKGTLMFTARANYSSSQNGEITFGNKISLKIQKPDPDLKIAKGFAEKVMWSDEEGNFYIHWKVTVTTKNGSGGPVDIRDVLTQGYLPSSFDPTNSNGPVSITRYDAAGTKKPLTGEYSGTYEIIDDGKELRYTCLPELQAGEKYELRYVTKITAADLEKAKATPGASNRMYNMAYAKSEKVAEIQKENYVTFNNTIIEKKGNLNSSGLIEWTVTIKAPLSYNGGFLKGYVLTDKILQGDVSIVGDITIKSNNNQTDTITQEKFAEGYPLSKVDNNAHTYTVTYKTTAPASGGAVENQAKITHDNIEFTAKASVNVQVGKWGLTKTHVRNDNDGKAYWTIEASNPTGAQKFELWDTIGAATNSAGQTVKDTTHYAYAAELQAALESGITLNLADGKTLRYAEAQTKGYLGSITYYDADGNVVLATDRTTPVMKMCVPVDTSNDSTVRVTRVELAGIPTHEELSSIPQGEAWTFHNDAKLVQGSSEVSAPATDTRHGDSIFTKEVSTDGQNYAQGSQTVEYDVNADHRLYYKITLVTTAGKDGIIGFSDQLPVGTTFTLMDKERNNCYLNDSTTPIPWGSYNNPTPWALRYDESTRTVTVKVQKLTPNKEYKITFKYSVTFDKDPGWNDLLTAERKYENTAHWGKDKTATTTTTVTRKVEPLTKTGEQQKNSNNELNNCITYTVIINPAGEILGDGKTLDLKDVMTVDTTSGASFYGSNVKLYYYDHGKPVSEMKPVPESQYTNLKPEGNEWLHMTVPDHTALLLQYDCIIANNGNEPVLSNTVSLNQYQKEQKLQFKTNSSSVTVSSGQLVIKKVDGTTLNPLQGAAFTLTPYDTDTKQFNESASMSDTTNASGELVFHITSGAVLPHVLYRLQETSAPAGYIKDSTPRYVFFYENGKEGGKTPVEVYQQCIGTDPVQDGETAVQAENVTFGTTTGATTLTVKNTYNQLTVTKTWLNASNNQTADEADIPLKSIKVQLYRRKAGQQPEVYGAQVELSKTNNWSHTWEGKDIPAKDENGEDWYYSVQELDTGLWKTTYSSNNDGIQTGSIYITNTIYSSYVLPSTGGMGTVPFAAVGGMLTVGAALLLAKRKKHEEKGE